MKTVLHKANTRGHADHGWLDTYHTFSFADYRNNERMGFGLLRVLNDDTVKAGEGFGVHPHNNMEIISIPLSGALAHGDSMGNKGVIKKGEVQVMSAGTGITHSEMNANKNEDVKFLQIWIFPNKQQVQPRYGQHSIQDHFKQNEFQVIVSPQRSDNELWIHQNAWLSLGYFDKNLTTHYSVKQKENGVYIFIIEGKIKMGDQVLEKRDGFGISEVDFFKIDVLEPSEILLIDVPMQHP